MAGSQKIKLYTIGCNNLPQLNMGAARHSITIQQLGPTSPPTFDEAGQVNGWSNFATGVLAGMQAIRGTDVIRGGLTISELYMEIATWWIPGLLPNMRVVYGASTYVIQSVDNVLQADMVAVMNCLGIGENI